MTGRRLLAALLSCVVPGLGQVLNGNLGLAAFCFGAFMVLLPAGYRLLLVLPQPGNLIVVAAVLSIVIISIVEAAVHDFTKGSRFTPTVPVVVALGIGMLVASRSLVLVNKAFNVELYKFPTSSMIPTVLAGDHFAVDRAAYGLRNPITGDWFWRWGRIQRGDLAVFLYPEDRSRAFIKRVVGLPGETVEIRDNVVTIDSMALDEPYVQFLNSRPSDYAVRDAWGPEVVPESHLFVLGDNRDNSRDSRYWGFVPVADVLGKAGVVYWSAVGRDPTTLTDWASQIRWGRLGLRLQ